MYKIQYNKSGDMIQIPRKDMSLWFGVLIAIALTTAAFIVPSARAEISIGEVAPAFSATNSNQKTVSLADFTGQRIILEWTNHLCPFVKKHYAVPYSNMQNLQDEAAQNNTVWLTVISSAPDKQGHVTGEKANALAKESGATPTHILLDESGDIGRLYGAKTTPHMYIIDESGLLAYDGAIDNKASTDKKHIEAADNYIRIATAQLNSGQAVMPSKTKPYGCSIKY